MHSQLSLCTLCKPKKPQILDWENTPSSTLRNHLWKSTHTLNSNMRVWEDALCGLNGSEPTLGQLYLPFLSHICVLHAFPLHILCMCHWKTWYLEALQPCFILLVIEDTYSWGVQTYHATVSWSHFHVTGSHSLGSKEGSERTYTFSNHGSKNPLQQLGL